MRLNLMRLGLARLQAGDAMPGDDCSIAGCGGRIEVYCIKQKPTLQKTIRYLACGKCGHKPDDNKWVTRWNMEHGDEDE